ncbi:MAG: hypothetical protein JWO13_1899 [Acidobacteriales bacterium]|nr:hypothetical protein [Terriglobales bacterium]
MLLATVLFVSSAFAQTAPAAKTEAQEAQNKAQTKDELLAYMQQTRKDFMKSVKGLSDAQLNFKAAPDKWSVKEVSEHIALSEDLLGGMSKNVMSTPAVNTKSEMYGKEEKLVAGMTDRSKKAQAPDALKPTGKWATEAEIIRAFNASRDKNVEFAKATPEADLRAHLAKTPIGTDLDAHEWLLFTASHTARHIKQIEEVKADPNFPKK